jgi:excisionase family DNA binding protein
VAVTLAPASTSGRLGSAVRRESGLSYCPALDCERRDRVALGRLVNRKGDLSASTPPLPQAWRRCETHPFPAAGNDLGRVTADAGPSAKRPLDVVAASRALFDASRMAALGSAEQPGAGGHRISREVHTRTSQRPVQTHRRVVTGGRAVLQRGDGGHAITSPLLTAREVAELLSVSAETVLRWTRCGELPAFRMPGGAIRFGAEELDEWLAARSA